jgi:hypothetical protein
MNPLDIYKKINNEWGFIDNTIEDDLSGTWRCITKNPLTKGLYRIELVGSTISDPETGRSLYSLHSEWYIETKGIKINSMNYNIV